MSSPFITRQPSKLKSPESVRAAAPHPAVHSVQITSQLYDGVWSQWVADTHTLVKQLPVSLQGGSSPSQDMLTFERWLVLLKVGAIMRWNCPGPCSTSSVGCTAMLEFLSACMRARLAACVPGREMGSAALVHRCIDSPTAGTAAHGGVWR